jgi:hypothetical protein
MSKLHAALTPPVSREVIDAMRRAFPGAKIEPGFDRDKAIHDAAQAKVVDWVEKKFGGDSRILGDPAELDKKAEASQPQKPKSWVQRAFTKVRNLAAAVVIGVMLVLPSSRI